MSFVFTIETRADLTLERVLRWLAGDALVVARREDGSARIHRALVSTRAIELSRRDDGWDVRVNVLSSRADWELALELVEAVAGETDGEVRSEAFGSVSVERLRELHDDVLVEEQNESGARSLAALARVRGPVSVPGVVRALRVGPRLVAELRATSDSKAAEQLVARLHRLQWVDVAEGYREADVLDSEVHWDIRERQLLAPADEVVLLHEGEPVVFPRLALALVAESLELLDEDHALVEPVRDVAALVARARAAART